jgi:hypothetical protein
LASRGSRDSWGNSGVPQPDGRRGAAGYNTPRGKRFVCVGTLPSNRRVSSSRLALCSWRRPLASPIASVAGLGWARTGSRAVNSGSRRLSDMVLWVGLIAVHSRLNVDDRHYYTLVRQSFLQEDMVDGGELTRTWRVRHCVRQQTVNDAREWCDVAPYAHLSRTRYTAL